MENPTEPLKTVFDFLATEKAEVSEHCAGERWEALDLEKLAELVAFIVKGQAVHAQSVIAGLGNLDSVFPMEGELQKLINNECIEYLSVPKDKNGKEERCTKKWHRDGFLFEAISWIVARKNAPAHALLRDPHVKATTQGLDGLMVVLDQETLLPISTTIFEDKCTEDQRGTFKTKVLPCFKDFHNGVNARSLLESVSSLLRESPISKTKISEIAIKALEKNIRGYRAGLVIEAKDDNEIGRKEIFTGYEEVDGIPATSRVAATLVVPPDLRKWFQEFAELVIRKL